MSLGLVIWAWKHKLTSGQKAILLFLIKNSEGGTSNKQVDEIMKEMDLDHKTVIKGLETLRYKKLIKVSLLPGNKNRFYLNAEI